MRKKKLKAAVNLIFQDRVFHKLEENNILVGDIDIRVNKKAQNFFQDLILILALFTLSRIAITPFKVDFTSSKCNFASFACKSVTVNHEQLSPALARGI